MIKFTVVTVAKNAAATLETCIASVAAQRYSPLEYIIVDGGSIDATAAIVARHRDVVDSFISEPDRGIYDAMNKGLSLATGDFVYFLGADDCLLDGEVLQDVAAFLDRHPDCDFAYGGISVEFPDGRREDFMPPPPDAALRFLVSGCLPHQASFASRRAFALAGRFDERYRIAGDYDWFLRVLTHPRLAAKRIDRIVASYRMDGASSRLDQSQKEVYAIQNGFPLYQRPEWLATRADIFGRELLSLHRSGEFLARGLGPRIWLPQALGLLGLVLAYPIGRCVEPFRRAHRLTQRIDNLQQRVLKQRMANDRLKRFRAS